MFLRKKAPLFLVLLIALLFSGTIAYVNLWDWLAVQSPIPKKTDAVFTFLGDDVRFYYSQQLLKKFPNCFWVISDSCGKFVNIALKSGADRKRVIGIDNCKNTLSEIHGLKRWLLNSDQLGRKPVIGLVSSPYHMRRIKMMISREFGEHKYLFRFLPVPLGMDGFSENISSAWWKNNWAKYLVHQEIKKIAFYLVSSIINYNDNYCNCYSHTTK